MSLASPRAYTPALLFACLLALTPAMAAEEPPVPNQPGNQAEEGDGGRNPQPASTDEAAPADTIRDEITVRESPSLTVRSPELAAAELAAVPGGTSFVDAERYEEGRVSTLKDALDFAPGVFVQPRFGAEEARLSIRGSGLQRTFHGRGLKLLQDGVPLNLADGGFDFQAVEPLAARHVEVYRGANGLAYGASTLGGAINFLSRTGHDATALQGRLEGGSFGYLRAQASTGGAQGNVDHYATLAHFQQDGFRDHSRQETQRLFGNLGYRLDARRESRFYLTAVATDSELPGSLTAAQLRSDPSLAAPGNLALDQKRDFDLLRVANRTSLPAGADGRLDLSASFSYKHLDHPIFQVLDQLSRDAGLELRYERQGSLRGRDHRLVLGLAPVVGWLDDDRFRNVAGARGDRTARGSTTSRNLDLYAEDRLAVADHLTLSAGVVLSFAGREFDDRFLSDGDQTDSQDFDGVSPKLGLLWQAAPGVGLFATVARSFEPPSFGELVNVGGDGLARLEAQEATSLELGSRGSAGRLTWDAVVYHARLDHEFLSLNDGQGNPLGTVNAGRTLHSGAEVGIEARLFDGVAGGSLSLRQTYLWNRFVFHGHPVYGDNRLAGVPEHLLRAELAWRHPRGLYGAPHLEWAPGRSPVDHANTLFAEGYTLVGARLGYRTSRGISAFLEGRNLTDRTYAATTGVIADARGRDSAQFLPGDGASVFAGLEARW